VSARPASGFGIAHGLICQREWLRVVDHRDLLEWVVAAEHARRLVEVEFANQYSNDHSGNGVTREVRDGRSLGQEPVDADYQPDSVDEPG
jgi:hypothetical protein